MKIIDKIPVSMWLLITIVVVYATWNPTDFSLYHFVGYGEGWLSARLLVASILLAIYALYLHETYQTFNAAGLLIFTGIIGAVLWLASDLGLLRAGNATVWKWITPAIFAIVLWLGLQGGRMYRAATGRMPVSVDHHHPAAQDHHHTS